VTRRREGGDKPSIQFKPLPPIGKCARNIYFVTALQPLDECGDCSRIGNVYFFVDGGGRSHAPSFS